jgi:hypothetical protein
MRRLCIPGLIGLAVLAATPVGADVLITTDGTVLETQGPWQQRGKVVVFTGENGQLSALRVEDVDFAATERWHAALAQTAPPPAAAEPAAKARLVLTDRDVARASAAPPPGEAADSTAAGDAAATPSPSPVRVIAWEDEEGEDGEGRRIFGTLRNDGNTFATGVTLEVTVYDDEGTLAGTQSTRPVLDALRPGESTTFSVAFPSVYAIGATRMRVSSLDLNLGEGATERDGDLPARNDEDLPEQRYEDLPEGN